MTKAIPHRHCVVCGRVIEAEETTCSDECRAHLGANKKRQRMMMLIFVGLMVLIIVLSAISRTA